MGPHRPRLSIQSIPGRPSAAATTRPSSSPAAAPSAPPPRSRAPVAVGPAPLFISPPRRCRQARIKLLPPFPLHPLLPRGAHALRPPKSQGNLSTIPAVDTSIRPGRARNNQSIGQRISRREEESRSPTSAARVGGPLRLRLCPAAPSFVVLALRRGSRIRDEEKEGEAFIGLRCVCRTARRRR